MSHGDQALGHRIPLKRIDFSPRWPVEHRTSVDVLDDVIQRSHEVAEGNRIWDLIKSASEGNGL